MIRILVIACVTFIGAACAGESETGAPAKVLVDVAALENTADVDAIEGIRTAGQPDAKAFEVFAEAGYKVVIDMRGADEDRGIEDEAALIEELGMEYVAFPITDEKQIDFDSAQVLDGMLQSYDGPVLIHCASSNRVGALLALRESLNGATDADALAYGREAGMTRLEPLVKERLASD